MAAIVAIGITRFGDRWDKDELGLAEEVLENLKREEGNAVKEAEEIFLANTSYPLIRKNMSLQQEVAEKTGISCIHTFHEECSGSIALQNAAEAVDSGRIHKALVIGTDKMSDLTSAEIQQLSAFSLKEEWQKNSLSLAAAYALLEKSYLERYKKKPEEMAALAVKAHAQGSRNSNAQFQNVLSKEQVNQSALVAEPIRQLECADWCDGAVAMFVVSDKEAESYKKKIYLKEHVQVVSGSPLDKENTFGSAIRKAAGMVKTKIEDIDVFEMHEVFSFGEVMCAEGLGCCRSGEGLQWIGKNNEKVNPGGGMKACGYVPAANGLRQAAEIVLQLRNAAGERQIKNAKTGLSVNLNGTGEKATINIFSVKK